MLTRRQVLAGGLGVAGLGVLGVGGSAAGLLPGRLTTRRWLGIGDVDRDVPDVATPAPSYGRFASEARKQDVGWALWVPELPAGVRRELLPVVLVLHGRGADSKTAFDALGWHRFAAAAFAQGVPPFALAAADGGSTYWHPRASGDDPVRMLTHELLPRVQEAGLGGSVGLWGWSMGGFGALTLAREAAAGRLTGPNGHRVPLSAVAAASPALFTEAGDTSPGSFDGPDDWARWGDVAARPGLPQLGLAASVHCGVDDPFVDAVRDYVDAAHDAQLTSSIDPGRHDDGYWRWSAPAHIDVLGRSLARRL